MIKLPHKLTKRTFMMYVKKEYHEDDGEERDKGFDAGYDAALENIGQEFLTDEELNKVFHSGK